MASEAVAQADTAQAPPAQVAQAAPKPDADILADIRREQQQLVDDARADAEALAKASADDDEAPVVEPPPAATPPTPAPLPTPKHSRHLVNEALRRGASLEAINAATADQLDDFLERAPAPQPPAPAAKPEPPVNDDPLADVDFGTDPATGEKRTADTYLDPTLAQILRSERAERKKLEAKFAAQEAAQQSAQQRQQQAQAQANINAADAHFAKMAAQHPTLFTTRKLSDFTDQNDPELIRRAAVFEAARKTGSFDKASEGIYGAPAAAPAKKPTDDALTARKKEWDGGGLLKPSNRTGSRDRSPKTRESTEAKVAEKLRELGIPDVDEPELSSVMFPD